MPGSRIAIAGRAFWPRRLVWAVLMAASALVVQASESPASSRHWAFQPLSKVEAPVPQTGQDPQHPIDRHLAARWREQGLEPVPPVKPDTLLRRASFDLTGLPPMPEERRRFLADRSPDAFERMVERLLRSPRYGERWGRHWMDVVRYADTAGDNADYPIPEAYRYRDYIIDSFNRDLPFDRFVQEQLAGDLLARERPDRRPEGIVATGFLALSRRYGTGPYELWHLTLENTIETVGQTFLGLNLKCARCHDHKFDPLTMRDYYGLYGIFASTEFPWAGSEEIASKNFNRQKFPSLESEEATRTKRRDWEARQEALRAAIAALEKEKPEGKSDQEKHVRHLAALKKDLRTLEKPGVPPTLQAAYAVAEGRSTDTALHLRGEPAQAGPVVPRCAPEALAGEANLQIAPGSSGRLEFARWLTSQAQDLTARVMVNRIWQHHFGTGLVATPNEFGANGAVPVHRDLLDDLARRFIASGWSVKAMHRFMMSSEAYRRSSASHAENERRDPANRYLWRFDRQRLEAESIRDAMLLVSGELDLSRPGPHPFPPPEQWTWTQHTPFKDRYDSKHRSVYLMTQRLQRHPFLALFDGPDTNNSTEARRASTVPQQALFAMNNPFLEQRAEALAIRVSAEEDTAEARLTSLIEIVFARDPAPGELPRLTGWLAQARQLAGGSGSDRAQHERLAWTTLARAFLASNEFLYVD